ncbi:MAG: class I SAM-dependent methyltransferase [Elusimicrobia bacterium]|nr:class I SAM-dependent methyltransferase [Elusimicrobiota bacterium]
MKPLENNKFKSDPGGIARQFGEEWSRYTEIFPAHREQFKKWIQPVPLEFFAGRTFLDAGCGMGRNALWALEAGAASGVAVDFDPRTVAAAQRNLEPFPRARVELASLYDLSFEKTFDVVFCLGVLHHLADPRRVLRRLVAALKPGGTLIVWVYGREGNEALLLLLTPLRALTRFLPVRFTLALAKGLTVLLRALLIWPWRRPYFELLRTFSFRHTESIVFDQLLPSIARYWSREEAVALLSDLPLTVKHVTHTQGMSWTLVAQRID